MRTTRRTTALAAAAAVLLTAGCGSAFPGPAAAEDFTDHFTSTYPDHVVDTVTQSEALFPWVGGKMTGLLVLADDTPPELVGEILGAVEDWQPKQNSSYSPGGVIANGVGLCLDDDQLDVKTGLRDRLYDEQLALAGRWDCPLWDSAESKPPTYRASFADFVQDTAMVTALIEGPDLVVHAEVSEHWGSVEAPWTQVPAHLGDPLDAVATAGTVTSFSYDPEQGLRIAVPPTGDLTTVRAVAEEAAGPDLPVQIMQGSLDPERAAALEELGPLADELREVPGVSEVSLMPHLVEVGVEDPDRVREVMDVALEHEEFAEVVLAIRYATPVGGEQHSYRYLIHPGAPGAEVDLFIGLIEADVVQVAHLAETGADAPGLRLTLTAPLGEGVPPLKAVLPDGVRVTATGSDSYARVEFTTARTLEAGDMETMFTNVNPRQIVADWNAAP